MPGTSAPLVLKLPGVIYSRVQLQLRDQRRFVEDAVLDAA
jgi:hypothetical protein